MNEIVFTYTKLKTVYFVVLNSSSLYWNGNTFETKNNSNWPSYVNNTTSNDEIYTGNFPPTISGGIYYIFAYEQNLLTPSNNDKLIRAGSIDWDGSKEYSGGQIIGDSTNKSFEVGFSVAKVLNIKPGVKNLGQTSISSGVKNG